MPEGQGTKVQDVAGGLTQFPNEGNGTRGLSLVQKKTQTAGRNNRSALSRTNKAIEGD